MSKVKIIFHGSQQFIEKDADAIQQGNFDYTDLGQKHAYKFSDGQHVTFGTQQTGQVSFLPQAADYTQSPPVQTVRFNELAFVDASGNLYELPSGFDFDVTTDMQAVNDFFLAQGGNPNFPNLDIINSAIPRWRIWVEPVDTDGVQETRNFINVNVQEARNVDTRTFTTFNVSISQDSPGVGWFDLGQAQFIFELGRTVPVINGIVYDNDVLQESSGLYTNSSPTRNRKGVIPRLSQRVGDMYDTILRGGQLDDNVDAFDQDRTNFPRLSLSGLEARQSNHQNNCRMSSFGSMAHATDGIIDGQDGRRGVVSKIAQVEIQFNGDNYIDSTNPRRDVNAKFDPLLNPCYLAHENQVFLAAASQDSPSTSIHGFGNATYDTAASSPILWLHNVPTTPSMYLRLDDDFHEKYFINSVTFEITRVASGGLTAAETAPYVLPFFSAQHASPFDDHDSATGGPFLRRVTPGDLFLYERVNFNAANSENITNALTDQSADALWQQGSSAGFMNFIQVNTTLMMPIEQAEIKRNVFQNFASNWSTTYSGFYPDLADTNPFNNEDTVGTTLPTYVFPSFRLKVNVWGYPKHVDREGIKAEASALPYIQHKVLGL